MRSSGDVVSSLPAFIGASLSASKSSESSWSSGTECVSLDGSFSSYLRSLETSSIFMLPDPWPSRVLRD